MTLDEIKVAAYNWTEPAGMTPNERCLWQGLGYTYECFRAGHDKKTCQELADLYIGFSGRRTNMEEQELEAQILRQIVRHLQSENEELKRIRQMDMAEIVKLRRQIEAIQIEGGNYEKAIQH